MGLGSRIRKKPIPDPGVKKAVVPWSGCTKVQHCLHTGILIIYFVHNYSGWSVSIIYLAVVFCQIWLRFWASRHLLLISFLKWHLNYTVQYSTGVFFSKGAKIYKNQTVRINCLVGKFSFAIFNGHHHGRSMKLFQRPHNMLESVKRYMHGTNSKLSAESLDVNIFFYKTRNGRYSQSVAT